MKNIAAKYSISLFFIASLGLAACGEGAAPNEEVTETVLGDIDVLEGSASDAMITVDEFDSNGERPAPGAGQEPAAADDDNAAAGEDAAETAAPNNAPDTIIRPRNAPAGSDDSASDGPDTGV